MIKLRRATLSLRGRAFTIILMPCAVPEQSDASDCRLRKVAMELKTVRMQIPEGANLILG